MEKKQPLRIDINRIIREHQKEMMEGEPLSIKGREDLMAATERIEYDVTNRTGKLYLAELCTVNYAGCIRLFRDIDKAVTLIEVYSGTKLDGIYRKPKDPQKLEEEGWDVLGFPF